MLATHNLYYLTRYRFDQRMPFADTAGLVVGLLVDGIGSGLILALLGLGITLVFGLGGILNLSIGVFSLIGILVAVRVFGAVPSLVVAVAVAMFVVGLFGLVVDRTLLPLVYRSEGEERMLIGIFATLGLAIFLEGLLVIEVPVPFLDTTILGYSDLYAVHEQISPFILGPILIRGSTLAVIALGAVVFVLLYLFFNRTYVGQATRTVMDDDVGATLCGIDTRRMRTLVFVLSAMIAAFAGVMYSLSGEVNVAESFALTINAVIVSVVGGVTSITGTIAAGLVLGIITTFAAAYIGAYLAAVALFAAAVVVLLARPEQIA